MDSISLLGCYASFLSPFNEFVKISNIVVVTFVLKFPTGRAIVPVVVVSCVTDNALISCSDCSRLFRLLDVGN